MNMLFEVTGGSAYSFERDRKRESNRHRAPLALLPSYPLYVTPGWHTNDGEMT